MKLYLGSDHAGYSLKEKIKIFLTDTGHEVNDLGAFSFDPNDDYPDFIRPVAEAVSQDPKKSRGVIFGGSGQGEAMCANRFKYIRAAAYYGGPLDIIKLSREHNDANVLSFGARFVTEDEAKKALEIWLAAPFDGGRHSRRIDKLEQ